MLGRTNTGGGGGGGGLNFKVIPNPMPSTAKENTIWVDTDKINNYYFSATQPENMAEYDVWFPTGTSSSVAFSAAKKNPIMVYPLSAKQYISGALVDKTAKSWQGGKWVDWITYLYNNGNQNTNLTGGWAFINNPTYPNGSGSFGESTITLNSNGGAPSAITQKMIDLTDVDTVVVNLLDVRNMVSFFATKNYVSDTGGSATCVNIYKPGVLRLDVSSLTGSYYIAVMCNAIGNGSFTATFDSVWME